MHPNANVTNLSFYTAAREANGWVVTAMSHWVKSVPAGPHCGIYSWQWLVCDRSSGRTNDLQTRQFSMGHPQHYHLANKNRNRVKLTRHTVLSFNLRERKSLLHLLSGNTARNSSVVFKLKVSLTHSKSPNYAPITAAHSWRFYCPLFHVHPIQTTAGVVYGNVDWPNNFWLNQYLAIISIQISRLDTSVMFTKRRPKHPPTEQKSDR